MEWYESINNLTSLAQHLIDQDGEMDTVYFLEKPWKWESEWNQYLKKESQT